MEKKNNIPDVMPLHLLYLIFYPSIACEAGDHAYNSSCRLIIVILATPFLDFIEMAPHAISYRMVLQCKFLVGSFDDLLICSSGYLQHFIVVLSAKVAWHEHQGATSFQKTFRSAETLTLQALAQPQRSGVQNTKRSVFA